MVAQSYSAGLAVAISTALVLTIAGPGCGGNKAAPVTPASTKLIEQAEQAERARRYDRARTLYERAITVATDDRSRAHAARKLALALIFWGEHKDAEAALARVLRWSPFDVPSWHDLGMVRHALGDLAGSERAFRRSIQLLPTDPRSRIALAALLTKQRRYPAAVLEYRALLELKLPGRVRGRVSWAIGLLERKIAGSKE